MSHLEKRNWLVRYFRARLSSGSEHAEDLAHDVLLIWVKLWLGKQRIVHNERALLHTLAHARFCNFLREQRVRKRVDFDSEVIESAVDQKISQRERIEDVDQLLVALKKLEGIERWVILRVLRSGLGIAEIAEELGIPAKQASRYKATALRRIRQEIRAPRRDVPCSG